jgi:uncharacterized phage protein (TIGR02218 family)
MVLSDQMFASRLRLHGGLSNPAVTTSDLVSGRWLGASVRLLATDWEQDEESVAICEGELGETKIDEGKLSMSVDLLPAALRRPPCVQTSPECRAVLGDALCRVDMRSRRLRVRVTAVEADDILVNESDTERFRMGRLRWISGANCGVEQVVIGSDGGRLSLRSRSSCSAAIGDRAILMEGCDGRRATCSERFNNILNFRGEPDLPGSEILLRFPGA